jgi:hypothetical protein
MAGGKLQWPIWKPYEIYAVIDHVYGAPGWENKDGFGGAQGALNGIETILYGLYLTIVFNNGVPIAGSWISGGWKISGKTGNRALIIGFAAAVMTLSKTILYCECNPRRTTEVDAQRTRTDDCRFQRVLQ